MPTSDFTIADVLEWARTKPADEEYDFLDPGVCALGLFAKERRGFSEKSAGCEKYGDLVGPELRRAAHGIGDGLNPKRWTFGALVKRLEKLCPETPVSASNWQAIDAYLADIEDVARERCSA